MSAPDPHNKPHGCGEDVASYVLGALDAQECELFEAHLKTCSICREELAALKLVVDALPAVAPQLTAPAQLKAQIMATVQSEAGWQRASASQRAPRRSWRALFAPRPIGAIAAAAAAIVALAIALAGGGGGTVTRTIQAQVIAPHASASVRLSGGHAELNVVGLPPTPTDRVYEVWVKRAGAPQPTDALFTVTTDGKATVGVPGNVAGVKQVLVTSEPLGGSRVPTRAPVIVASLS